MNREDDLKNLWKELYEISEAKTEEKEKTDDSEPKETVELDSLLSRLEDVVSRLEEALGKKEEDGKEDGKEANNDKEETKEESYVPRRIRRPLRNRE